jgi:hypothetical protein
MDQMKLQQVYQKLHESYHGNPVASVIPMVNDCIKGEGCFGSFRIAVMAPKMVALPLQ